MEKEKIHIILLSLDMQIQASLLLPAIWSTNVVGINRITINVFENESAKMGKSPLDMPGSWKNLKLSVNMVSPWVSPCGNLRPVKIWPSLMLQDTEILSKI